jgi:hypothetical protein
VVFLFFLFLRDRKGGFFFFHSVYIFLAFHGGSMIEMVLFLPASTSVGRRLCETGTQFGSLKNFVQNSLYWVDDVMTCIIN